MNYQEIVDGFVLSTCIISVEKFPDGGYGNIRIVAGNKPYVDSIENPANGASAHMLNNKFIPDSPYEKYIPKDLNFEQAVYKSAVLKMPIHTYIKPERFFCWMNQYIMPLESDEPNIGYCSYSIQITMENNTEMMSNISATAAQNVLETCIKLRGSNDFKKTVNDVLMDICELSGANKCCLLQTDFTTETCSMLAEVVVDESLDIAAHKEDDALFYDLVKTWDATIAGSNCLIIEDERSMNVLKERDPRWYESLKNANIKTIVLFPLRNNGETLGYLWAVNFNPENTLRIKETLELSTYFIASELANYMLLKRLEVMSSVDLLTGVYNRNAMNNRVDRYISGTDIVPKAYGVIFADLNGLKQVNDDGGHSAGDKLLKNAADILRGLFCDSDIYRAGGDEFMIIAENVPKEVLEERMEKLRRDSEDPNNVSFAVGGCYEENGGDIRFAMHNADERMYEDKKQYYKKFPERKRK